MSENGKRQPTLALLPGDKITLESILAMFRHLTGREPTEEEVEEARAELAGEEAPEAG